ncbi:FecR family protein [Daejeonella lutea]|uniref:FecR family protein n=1 Tax=Daejeonella lutea TaxID=572036 RepID=A0A1T5DHT4_9SPHI|nr:FecR domain-containing protein [Daejeonella lutea]SKB71197.1 FecR family protein [Daejeonella lutea]
MSEDLIIKYLLQETTANEEERVKEWIAAGPENEKEFKRFELIWSSSKELETSRTADADKAWDNFKTKVSGHRKVVKPNLRSIRRDYSWLKIAAVVFIVAAAWTFYSTVNNGYATLESGNLVRKETLPDGSEVTLNKNSRIAYSRKFTGDTRSVKLEKGEVFFNVTADKSKPFIIEADEVVVRVVGTSFNVKHNSHITEIIVETGIVQVAKAGRMVELRAGERVSIDNNNPILRKKPNTDKLYKFYRSKIFVADNTPLWRVVEVLNEAYESNIIIENDQHKNLSLNTTFEDESLEEILRVITQTFKINAVKENGKIILR